MDDFNVSALHESKNEWGSRLLILLTPLIIDGFKSIFKEANEMCQANHVKNNYLMTFQNLITRVPKWNAAIVEQERKRIIQTSKCTYLEELVTCIHIIQLKILSAMRVGQKQKKIDIHIPKLDDFIHKVYINSARKLYNNVYLFELNIPPLQIQKHNRELEILVQECILNTVRESIPVESLLRAYMDETIEDVVEEEIQEQIVEPPPPPAPSNSSLQQGGNSSSLTFNDVDAIMEHNGQETTINAPKTIDRLEEISVLRNMQRKMEESNGDAGDGEEDIITISNEDIPLSLSDFQSLDNNNNTLDTSLGEPQLIIDDIEVIS